MCHVWNHMNHNLLLFLSKASHIHFSSAGCSPNNLISSQLKMWSVGLQKVRSSKTKKKLFLWNFCFRYLELILLTRLSMKVLTKIGAKEMVDREAIGVNPFEESYEDWQNLNWCFMYWRNHALNLKAISMQDMWILQIIWLKKIYLYKWNLCKRFGIVHEIDLVLTKERMPKVLIFLVHNQMIIDDV